MRSLALMQFFSPSYMAHFEAFLHSKKYIAKDKTIYGDGDLPPDTPFFIVAWIMSL